MMIKVNNPATVALLKDVYRGVIEGAMPEDQQIPILEGRGELLYDSGQRKSSTTYDTALQMVAEAQDDISLVTQYFPEERLLERMVERAAEGVLVSVVLQPDSDHRASKLPHSLGYRAFERKINQLPEDFFVEQRFTPSHTRLLMTDSEKMIFGSHNLFDMLVKYVGSRELSLLINDTDFINDFILRFLISERLEWE